MRFKSTKGLCSVQRFVVLVLFSLIVLSVGCGDAPEAQGTGRDTSTPMKTLIGHWRRPHPIPGHGEDEHWYYREDFTGTKVWDNGDITEFNWKVLTQNLKTHTIKYQFLDAYYTDDNPVIYEVSFTEDFNSHFMIALVHGEYTASPNAKLDTPDGHYVDAAQKP